MRIKLTEFDPSAYLDRVLSGDELVLENRAAGHKTTLAKE